MGLARDVHCHVSSLSPSLMQVLQISPHPRCMAIPVDIQPLRVLFVQLWGGRERGCTVQMYDDFRVAMWQAGPVNAERTGPQATGLQVCHRVSRAVCKCGLWKIGPFRHLGFVVAHFF